MEKVKIKINNLPIECQAGQTILGVAERNGITIPSLCNHQDFSPHANCRVCLVEIIGKNNLVTACSTQVADGMEITTDSIKVKKMRNLNIELLFAEHIEKCPTCVWRMNCQLLEYAEKYKIEIRRFKDRKTKRSIYKFANAVEIDSSQCIDCRNCLEACNKSQKIGYLKLQGKGSGQEVAPVSERSLMSLKRRSPAVDCIYCGQCAAHCPVSAAQEQEDWQDVEKLLKDTSLPPEKSNKVVVAQFAPAVRVSLGEEFGLPYGRIVTDKLVAGLFKLGFRHAFDVSFAADVTTMIEAKELLERLAPLADSSLSRLKKEDGRALPMLTSCCPAWVKYVEFYHPELIPNLTASRSPHIHNGGIIKTYLAAKLNLKPANIIVVSVMPCTAKKYEISRPELKVNGLPPVDYVITTRELALLLKRKKIDIGKLREVKADNPLAQYSGARVIYGGSGGVMESALRTAQFLACKNKSNGACKSTKIEFEQVRGLGGVKEAYVGVGEKKLRLAVVNGIGNIKYVLDKINDYNYIEVMACPGGCIGGGGQPIPTTWEIRRKRIAALYQDDKNQKIRKAHENKAALDILEWLKQNGLERQALYTTYKKKN